MAGIDDLLKSLPIDQIAGKLGIDPATAQSAASGLLPAIFGGLHANAQDPAGAASIHEALTQHSPALVEGGVNVDDVDTDDGAKIAGHIFGPQQDQVVAKVAETTGTQPSILSRMLPALAPIAMSYLSRELQGRGPQAATQAAPGAQPTVSGGLGGVLGSMLGGAGGSGGLDVSTILGGLGGLLGGGRR